MNEKKTKSDKKNAKEQNKQRQKKKRAPEKQAGSKRLGGFLFLKMARGARSEIFSNAETVNRLNVFPVADGDTGDNMRLTVESGLAAIENLNTDDLAQVIKTFSHGMLLGARGNSGVILSQLFSGMARGLQAESAADPYAIGRALRMGVEQAYTSVLTPTEGTILTVARESVEFAVSHLTPESTVRSLFRDLVSEMYRSLHRTPDLLAVLREAGVVDSGGAGLYYIMDGFYRVLCGTEPSEVSSVGTELAPGAQQGVTHDAGDTLRYRYCTEVLLTLREDAERPFSLDALKHFLTEIGDSVVSAVADGLLKVHVHTNAPERVIAYIHPFGELVRVKVENMALQHTALTTQSDPPMAKFDLVTVASGARMREIFTSLGAHAVVDGGRTGNPSAADFHAAFRTLRAEHIIVLPNNKNTLLAARQSAQLYTDAIVHVVPTRDVGEGFVALGAVALDATSADDVLSSVQTALSRITTAYLAPAVRDAEIDGVRVRDGDTLGAIGKHIVLCDPTPETAVTALADRLLADSSRYTLTVFTGEGCTQDLRDALCHHLDARYSEVEYHVIQADLPTVTMLFVAE